MKERSKKGFTDSTVLAYKLKLARFTQNHWPSGTHYKSMYAVRGYHSPTYWRLKLCTIHSICISNIIWIHSGRGIKKKNKSHIWPRETSEGCQKSKSQSNIGHSPSKPHPSSGFDREQQVRQLLQTSARRQWRIGKSDRAANCAAFKHNMSELKCAVHFKYNKGNCGQKGINIFHKVQTMTEGRPSQ